MSVKKKTKHICPRCGSRYKVPGHVIITESAVCPSCFRKEREHRVKVKRDRSAASKRRRRHHVNKKGTLI